MGVPSKKHTASYQKAVSAPIGQAREQAASTSPEDTQRHLHKLQTHVRKMLRTGSKPEEITQSLLADPKKFGRIQEVLNSTGVSPKELVIVLATQNLLQNSRKSEDVTPEGNAYHLRILLNTGDILLGNLADKDVALLKEHNLLSPTEIDQLAKISKQRFTVGATEKEVLAIQGRPTSIAGSLWYYGNSFVVFQEKRVTGWTVVGYPLRAKTPPPSPVPPSKGEATRQPDSWATMYITLGSTKEQVARIQGTPSTILRLSSTEIWYYGASSITFDDGVVTEWNNSRLGDTLRVRIR